MSTVWVEFICQWGSMGAKRYIKSSGVLFVQRQLNSFEAENHLSWFATNWKTEPLPRGTLHFVEVKRNCSESSEPVQPWKCVSLLAQHRRTLPDQIWVAHTPQLSSAQLFVKKRKSLVRLEVWFYMNGPSKLHAAISSKQFFGLELLF